MIFVVYHVSFGLSSSAPDMNFTPGDDNVLAAMNNQEMLAMVISKNVTVVVLGITINYINATMVHTFNKHHVCKIVLLKKKR